MFDFSHASTSATMKENENTGKAAYQQGTELRKACPARWRQTQENLQLASRTLLSPHKNGRRVLYTSQSHYVIFSLIELVHERKPASKDESINQIPQ